MQPGTRPKARQSLVSKQSSTPGKKARIAGKLAVAERVCTAAASCARAGSKCKVRLAKEQRSAATARKSRWPAFAAACCALGSVFKAPTVWRMTPMGHTSGAKCGSWRRVSAAMRRRCWRHVQEWSLIPRSETRSFNCGCPGMTW